MATPVIHVLAGPNGAGKSTLYARVIEPATHLPFVNADVMLAEHPELYADAYGAGHAAAERRNELLEARTSFVTETVFSHPSKVKFLRDAVDAGYLVHLHVVAIPVELAVARVAQRAAHGGHNVAEDKLRTRYTLLWMNVAAALPIVRELTVYDNSKADGPKQIAHFRDGQPTRPIVWPAWAPTDQQLLAPPPPGDE